MHETMVKTHLIITDIHEEYYIDWCGSIANTQPVIENGKPIFVVANRAMGKVEVNTTDLKYLEDIAKRMTGGDIGALPTYMRKGKSTPCQWCGFKAICRNPNLK